MMWAPGGGPWGRMKIAVIMLCCTLVASCASHSLVTLDEYRELDSAADSFEQPLVSRLPQYMRLLGAAGYSVLHIDGRNLSPYLIHQLTGINGLNSSIVASALDQIIVVFDLPPEDPEKAAFAAYVSLGVGPRAMGRRLEKAGFLPSTALVSRGSRRRWELPAGMSGPSMKVEHMEQGLYLVSYNTSLWSARQLLPLLERPTDTVAGAIKPVAVGAAVDRDSDMLNFFGRELTGMQRLGIEITQEPANRDQLNISAELESASALQARALSALFRLILLAVMRESSPDLDSEQMRASILLEHYNSQLFLRDYPLSLQWLGIKIDELLVDPD